MTVFCLIPQLSPTKMDDKKNQFLHSKLISFANDRLWNSEKYREIVILKKYLAKVSKNYD